MSEREQIHNYLVALNRYLSRLQKHEADDVLREIESHIYDAIDEQEKRGEKVDPASVLEGFGRPRELADSYINHIQLGAPPPQGFAAIKSVKRGVSKALYYGMAIFGYAFAITLIFTAMANLVYPESVGIWSYSGGNSIVIGFFENALPESDELMGFWYTPFALVAGYCLVRLTKGIMDVLKPNLQVNQ